MTTPRHISFPIHLPSLMPLVATESPAILALLLNLLPLTQLSFSRLQFPPALR